MGRGRRFTWDNEHLKGLLLGILTTIIAFPIAAYLQGRYSGSSSVWYYLSFVHDLQAKVLGWAAIPNLIWFHFFLRKKKWGLGKGIIYATIINLLVILVLKYLL